MKAVGLTEFGGPEVLRVVTLPSPEPGPGEVRIRVHAVAVNPTDATFRAGGRAAQLAERTPPWIPGVDVAGVVDKVGPGTSGRLAQGERVIALVVPMGPHGGTYAEQIVVSEQSAVRAPKKATDAEAATLLLNAVAAQLARMRRLTVIADTPPGEEDLIRGLGASQIVARGASFAGQVRDLMPGGVPGLVDGANLDAGALPAIADGGAIATVKGWSGPAERGITVHPISAFTAVTSTTLLEDLPRHPYSTVWTEADTAGGDGSGRTGPHPGRRLDQGGRAGSGRGRPGRRADRPAGQIAGGHPRQLLLALR